MKVYNSLTKRKEEFISKDEKVKMYVCGITPYDVCHIGHARCYIVYDIIHRYLEYKGYDVFYVQNFTDIDDKIIKRAKDEKVPPSEISEKYIKKYFEDMDSLGIKRADIYPKVSEHIQDIIFAISKLIENGFGYCAGGDVYFSVDKFDNYGKLSGRNKKDMLAGARVEIDEKKENPLDFALWKKAKEGEISFKSPWGEGRPGWHIECSVMSSKYLGDTLTIHGGAQELIFPHHENEIAQSEALTGKSPFVRYWIHNGLVTVSSQKMSKSLGNFITISELLSKYHPDIVRFYFLKTHYRSPINFVQDDLLSCKVAFSKLKNTKLRLEEILGPKTENCKWKIDDLKNEKEKEFYKDIVKCKEKFIECMDDDFNTATAISYLFEISNKTNKLIDEEGETNNYLSLCFAYNTFLELCSILGFFEKEEKEDIEISEEILQNILSRYSNEKVEGKINIINKLIEIRNQSRNEKNWKIADEIRKELNEVGIILEDKPNKTTFKYESHKSKTPATKK